MCLKNTAILSTYWVIFMRSKSGKMNLEQAATPPPKTVHTKIHTGIQLVTNRCGGHSGYGTQKSVAGIAGTKEAARRSLDMLIRKKNGEPIKTKLVISDLPDGNYFCTFISWVDRGEVCDE